jgi:hypothetical protein
MSIANVTIFKAQVHWCVSIPFLYELIFHLFRGRPNVFFLQVSSVFSRVLNICIVALSVPVSVPYLVPVFCPGLFSCLFCCIGRRGRVVGTPAYSAALDVVAELLAHLLRIREVSASNLGPVTGYNGRFFVVFLSSSMQCHDDRTVPFQFITHGSSCHPTLCSLSY